MTQPPEITLEPRTDTQKLEDAIRKACAIIRDNWAHMIQAGETQAPGRVNPSGVMLDDHDARESDTRRIDRVISHRRYAQDVLAAVCELIRDDRPVTNPASFPYRTDVPGMAAFIDTHAEWLSWQGPDTLVAEDLGKVARKVQLIVTPPVKDWIALGSCPLEVESVGEVAHEGQFGDVHMVVCNGSVRAWPKAEDRDGEVMARCRKCGQEAVTTWWEGEMFKDAELKVLLTADEVVTFVHKAYHRVIKAATVRQWDKRGTIEPAGFDEKGRRLYHRDALVWALDMQAKREGGGL